MLSIALVALLDVSTMQASAVQGRGDGRRVSPNTWSARSSTGRTVSGTWTVSEDSSTGSVTGTWTLDDANGKALMRGGWSAAKAPTGWNGAWRAIVSGSKTEYAGTWTADVDLKRGARFADMFKLAVEKVVSGGWKAGGQSGAWSIRVFE